MWKSADLLPALIEMLMTPKAPGKQKLLENLFLHKTAISVCNEHRASVCCSEGSRNFIVTSLALVARSNNNEYIDFAHKGDKNFSVFVGSLPLSPGIRSQFSIHCFREDCLNSLFTVPGFPINHVEL